MPLQHRPGSKWARNSVCVAMRASLTSRMSRAYANQQPKHETRNRGSPRHGPTMHFVSYPQLATHGGAGSPCHATHMLTTAHHGARQAWPAHSRGHRLLRHPRAGPLLFRGVLTTLSPLGRAHTPPPPPGHPNPASQNGGRDQRGPRSSSSFTQRQRNQPPSPKSLRPTQRQQQQQAAAAAAPTTAASATAPVPAVAGAVRATHKRMMPQLHVRVPLTNLTTQQAASPPAKPLGGSNLPCRHSTIST